MPWNPIGAVIAPLALASLYYSRKKGEKRSPWALLLFVALLVSACCPQTTPTVPTQQPDPTPAPPQTPTPNDTNTGAGDPGAPADQPTATTCPPGECNPAPPSPMPTATPSLADYGVTLVGTWDEDMVLRAVSKVGARFSEKLDNIGSVLAFTQTYGPIIFQMNSGGGICQGGISTVTCWGNDITDRLLVHELGHTLVQTRYPETRTPYTNLKDAQIIDDTPEDFGGSRWVTGTHPTRNDCETKLYLDRECVATNKSDPNDLNYNFRLAGQFERTMLGYLSDKQPDVYHGPKYGALGFTDWNSPNEDFADMYMNWIYSTFNYAPTAYNAGWNRYYWMDINMYNWITG